MAVNETTKARVTFTDRLITGVVLILSGLMIAGVSTLLYDRYAAPSTAMPLPTATLGNVGGQAPASVRGTNPETGDWRLETGVRGLPATSLQPLASSLPNATPIPGIAQSPEEAERLYQEAIRASEAAPESAPPLPLNSAGDPVIDTVQQQQLDQSAQMAADEQQAAILAQQLADADSRAPDVSKADAESMMHRNLCSVPRANPHTCDRGLFKPTPIGGE